MDPELGFMVGFSRSICSKFFLQELARASSKFFFPFIVGSLCVVVVIIIVVGTYGGMEEGGPDIY